MKKIFISLHYMELGGAERALLGLLEALAKRHFQVDLFIYSHQGELMEFIPEGINLLPENSAYACYEKGILRTFLLGHPLVGFARLWAKVMDYVKNRHFRSPNTVPSSIADEMGRATNAILPSLHYLGEYDLAISFLNPHYYLRDKVLAKKKIGWFHTDYSKISINPKRELPVWDSLDYIAGVSKDSVNTFLSFFPELSQKTLVIKNILPTSLILKESSLFDANKEMTKGPIKLLSIGRFSPQKNFPYAVEIMSELCKLRSDVVWYLIGYGSEEELIRQQIVQLHLQDRFIILGKKANPYPYIKACDLYIQPSIYEGKAVTVQEAQFLKRPVVITDFPSASSQINHNIDGCIIPLESPQEAAQSIHLLLKDPIRMQQLVDNSSKQDFNGKETIRILENILAQ